MTMTTYRNPETGERRILSGSDTNRQAMALEAEGWELVVGEPPPTLVPAAELEAAMAEIERLERAVARLEKKLERLKAKEDDA